MKEALRKGKEERDKLIETVGNQRATIEKMQEEISKKKQEIEAHEIACQEVKAEKEKILRMKAEKEEVLRKGTEDLERYRQLTRMRKEYHEKKQQYLDVKSGKHLETIENQRIELQRMQRELKTDIENMAQRESQMLQEMKEIDLHIQEKRDRILEFRNQRDFLSKTNESYSVLIQSHKKQKEMSLPQAGLKRLREIALKEAKVIELTKKFEMLRMDGYSQLEEISLLKLKQHEVGFFVELKNSLNGTTCIAEDNESTFENSFDNLSINQKADQLSIHTVSHDLESRLRMFHSSKNLSLNEESLQNNFSFERPNKKLTSITSVSDLLKDIDSEIEDSNKYIESKQQLKPFQETLGKRSVASIINTTHQRKTSRYDHIEKKIKVGLSKGEAINQMISLKEKTTDLERRLARKPINRDLRILSSLSADRALRTGHHEEADLRFGQLRGAQRRHCLELRDSR